MRTPITFSRPSASTARNAVSEESTARQPHDPLREAPPPHHLVPQETHEPAARQLAVNGERVAFLHPSPDHVNRGNGNGKPGSLRSIGRRIELDRRSLDSPFPLSLLPFPQALEHT